MKDKLREMYENGLRGTETRLEELTREAREHNNFS